jgi:hypothetical protein
MVSDVSQMFANVIQHMNIGLVHIVNVVDIMVKHVHQQSCAEHTEILCAVQRQVVRVLVQVGIHGIQVMIIVDKKNSIYNCKLIWRYIKVY